MKKLPNRERGLAVAVWTLVIMASGNGSYSSHDAGSSDCSGDSSSSADCGGGGDAGGGCDDGF